MVIISKWLEKYKRPISLRLFLFIVLSAVGLVPLLFQDRLMLGSIRQSHIDGRILDIQSQCTMVGNQLAASGYFDNPAQNAVNSQLAYIADIFDGRIILVDRNFKTVRDTYSLEEGKLNITEAVIRCFQGSKCSYYDKQRNYFEFTLPIYSGAGEKNIIGVMLVSASTEEIQTLVETLDGKMRLLEVAIAVALLSLAFLASHWLVRPFKSMVLSMNKVAEGNLDEDVTENTYTETKQISGAISRTLTRLKALDQSRQEFVSNVSHELKTPITSIRVLADSLTSMEDAPVELYREFLSDISVEIDRESKIIDDLLSLVKMDKAATELAVSQADINNLLKTILKRLRPIAQKRNIELILESFRPVMASVDEVKLSLAFSNLVENAIKYNVEDGWVKVTLDADHKFFYVKVSDSGIGIPEEFQEHIFERFYRVDKARSRETGGTGLGLAITKSVVLLHHGALKVASKEGEGTTFTVRIPLSYIA